MTHKDLEQRALESDEPSDRIVQTFMDAPDRKPKTLSDLAKPYGSDAYRFAQDMEKHYTEGNIGLAPSPGTQHPRYKLNIDAVKEST